MRRYHVKHRPSVVVLLALVLAPLSVGLGSLQAAPVSSPSPGGTMTIARGGDVISFDPYLATAPVARQVYDNVYDQLVVINPDLTLSPGLAERWQVVNDRTWRFYLRKGVKFHDGSEFTSDAVKFHFDRMLGYLPGSKPGRPAPFMDMIQEVRTSGPYVVTFRLTEPFGPLLNHLAPAWSGIPCPEAVKKLGDRYGESACGTGPFMFQEWRKGEQVTLVKNPQYWRGPALLDRIIWRTIPDAKTRLLAFQRDEVGAVYQPPEHEVRPMFKDRNVTLHKDITLRTYYIGFNVQKEPFTDVRVRRAMSHAVNALEIVEYVLEGVGRTPLGYFHPRVQGFSKAAIIKFDPARAESLLEEAGWRKGPDGVRVKEGRRLEFTLLVSNQGLPRGGASGKRSRRDWRRWALRPTSTTWNTPPTCNGSPEDSTTCSCGATALRQVTQTSSCTLTFIRPSARGAATHSGPLRRSMHCWTPAGEGMISNHVRRPTLRSSPSSLTRH